MKKAVIFYFSGTGNTWWVSNRIMQHLRTGNFDAYCYSIERISTDEANTHISSAAIVGFGYPVYGSDLPLPMKDFIENLACFSGTPAFVFCTQYMFSGDGAAVSAGFLRKKGFVMFACEHFLMPNNVCVQALRIFSFTNDPQKIEKIKQKTDKKILRFTSGLCESKGPLRGSNIFSLLLGLLQRAPFRKYFAKWRNDISIDNSICTGCMRCVNICPSANLFSSDGNIMTSGTCVLCLRCYNFCPVLAVKYIGKLHDPKRGVPYKGPGEGFCPEDIKN